MTKTDWKDFEQGLIDNYNNNPTVENAEVLFQHFSDQVKANEKITNNLQAFINDRLLVKER